MAREQPASVTQVREAVYAAGTAAVLRGHRLITSRVETTLALFDLSMARFEVLGLLNARPDGCMTFTELKLVTLLHAATMGHNVNRLEAAGLLRRRRDDRDGRALIAQITPAGRRLADRATEALADIRFGLTELAPDRANALVELLRELGP